MSLPNSTTVEIEGEVSDFRKFLEESSRVPFRLGESAILGSSLKKIRVKIGDEIFSICAVPEEATITVNQEEAEEVESSYIVLDEGENYAYYVEKRHEFLPIVRQNYHKGYYHERKFDYIYEFKTETRNDEEIFGAKYASDPVQRPEEKIKITKMTPVNRMFPLVWLCESESGKLYTLRERSGSVKMYEHNNPEELIFQLYVGGEHPGTKLKTNEILNLAKSFDFIEISDNVSDVSEEQLEKYWDGFKEVFQEGVDLLGEN